MNELYWITTNETLSLETRYAAVRQMQAKRATSPITRSEEPKAVISLTQKQAELYEFLKTGTYSRLEAKHATNLSCIDKILVKFHREKLATRTGTRNSYRYTAIERPYKVVHANTKPEEPVIDPDESYTVKLTPGQEEYLKNHLKEKRSLLAKKLGITKLQLNFAIERLR